MFIFPQISNYSINYFNGGKYPLPQTLMVRYLFKGSPQGLYKYSEIKEGVGGGVRQMITL